MPNEKKPLSIAVKLKRPLSQPGERLPNGLGLMLRLFPLIESLTPGQLDDLAQRTRQISPHYTPTDYSFWCQFATPAATDPHGLVKAVRLLPLVEKAYVMRAAPPPSNLKRRSLSQAYLGPAPKGINARYVRKHYAGGDGAGIGFIDIEQGWNRNHDDLPNGIQLIWGDSQDFFSHGTSVLGVVLMADNGFGGIGVAPSARGRVASQWVSGVANTVDAIKAATFNLTAGDVMLLEVQEYAPDPPGSVALMPAEVLPGNFEAICDAVARGIVVIEPAANNMMDLGTYPDASGTRIFGPGGQVSGAIMVSASTSTPLHTRILTSNFGSRVDCFAWGQKVATADTDGAGKNNQKFRTDFGDTSGASAIIAGAALVIQGIAQANNLGSMPNGRFSPADLLRFLITDGTPSANGKAVDGIGVMPNLRKIATALGVPKT